jgi:phospholipid/cholesterol/gamma-HCH transport system substrate-binding protein
MQKSASQVIRLGVFVIMGTMLLVAALYFIGNRQNLFGNNIELKAEFANVNGLQLGNNVRYSGINAGTVKKIDMISPSRIVVSMVLDENIASQINKNAVATIGSDGLVGNMIINILPQEGASSPIVSGDIIATYTKIGANDILSTLSVTNENAAILTSDLLKITTKIIDGKGTIGMLINDTIMANDLKQSVYQLKEASLEARKGISKLNDMISSLNFEESVVGVLLNDTVSANQMKRIITELENTSNHINRMSENMDTYIVDIKSSEGVLNKFVNDKVFAKEIDSTIINIKEASIKLNENMEALKHNMFFRGYFKKLEREKKRREKDSIKNLK